MTQAIESDKKEGAHENSQERGRDASAPREIPHLGWKDIFFRVKDQFFDDNLTFIAAGVTYFTVLAIIPGLASLVSIYSYFSDPAAIQDHVDLISGVAPDDVLGFFEDQISTLAKEGSIAGYGAFFGVLFTIWSSSRAIDGLMTALNIVYHEKEKRNFFVKKLIALALTLGAIAMGILILFLVIVVPLVLNQMGLAAYGQLTVSLLRWPILAAVFITGLAVLYRFAPCRSQAQWKWLTWGSATAALFWLAGAALFSWFVANFGDFNRTYGSMGSIVILMLWVYLSAIFILLGAELNSEMEHQTARDTTTGEPAPMGERNAHVADTLGKTRE